MINTFQFTNMPVNAEILYSAIILTILFFIGYYIFHSPFEYPYFIWKFDVTGKRKPRINDYIDRYINKGGFDRIESHEEAVMRWKADCERKISHGFLIKRIRRRQYLKCLDDNHAYRFYLIRYQTRYRQRNYKKTSYKVETTDSCVTFSYDEMAERYNKLKEIGFESSLHDYHSTQQRKLMTRELRVQIMVRDNYTCRICGKYMPDEVGLQIDHIVPVAKGGKTVPSNLQVLCSKCNSRKRDKLVITTENDVSTEDHFFSDDV